MTTKIYFASPLFSEMEQQYNEQVVQRIEHMLKDEVEVYLPQRNLEINDKSKFADSKMIADGDNEKLEEADILISVIDGQSPDVGVAAETGYFYSTGKPILGIYSDSRQGNIQEEWVPRLNNIGESQTSYVNLYLIGLIKNRGKLCGSKEEMLEGLHNLVSGG